VPSFQDPFLASDPSALNSRITATIADFRPEITWNILEKSRLLKWMAGVPDSAQNAEDRIQTGAAQGFEMRTPGPAIYMPFIFQTGGTAPTWVEGYDRWQIAGSDENRWFQYGWRFLVKPIAISLQEKRENLAGGRGFKILDLVKTKLKVATAEIADELGDKIITSDGTGTDGKEILGLQGIIKSNPTAASSTLGGWDQTSHSSLRNRYNGDLAGSVTAGAAGAFSTEGLPQMIRMTNTTSRGLYSGETDLLLFSQDVHEAFERILLGRDVVYRQPGDSGAGYIGAEGARTLYFKGIPCVWDTKMPTGSVAANNNMIYFLNFESLKLCVDEGLWLTPMPWKDHYQQLVSSCHIVFSGNMVCGEPRVQGVIDGYTV
jgi:hypothetical protein